ncbi:MAG: hypothetical protein KAJ24_01115, partial [Candidatus Aenigmarchaeota archaeon]|nr:hypothetical protein [Candidatus Aenigmarchaeota archaeon]
MASQAHAYTIGEGTIIKPNTTATGHYIINNTVTLTQLTVNDTHATFEGLDSNNQTVLEINATGDFVDTLCYGSSTCILPQISTIKSIYFTLDNTAPTTTINDTDATTWRTIAPSFTLSCSDGSGAGCDTTLYCNDTANICTPSAEYTAAVTASIDGTFYVRYKSNDTVGNEETVNSQTYKYDKYPTTITIDYTNESTLTDNTPSFTFNVTDGSESSTNTTNCSLYINDVFIVRNGSVYNATDTTITSTNVYNDGNHTFYISCTEDAISRTANTSEYLFVLD